MASVKLQKLFLAGLISVISSASFADVEQVTLNSQHLQTLSVEHTLSSDYLDTYQSGIRNTSSWSIKSNNGVVIGFSGASPEGDGIADFPRFYKQEVDAKNNYITGQYDYLDTKFGIMILSYDSIEKGTSNLLSSGAQWSIWEGGIGATGTPEILTDMSHNSSPIGYWGTIMPNDEGYFSLSLYSNGFATASTQSGLYTITVVFNVTANEQLNP